MDEVLAVLLRIIGIAYYLASLVMMRAAAMDYLMDQMLTGLTLQPVPNEDNRRRWFAVIIAIGVGMGGAALLLLSPWALPLFVAAFVAQMANHKLAGSPPLPEDHADNLDRREAIRITVFYAAATAFVVIAMWLGLLRPWQDPWALLIPVVGIVPLLTVGRHFLWKPRQPADGATPPAPREIAPPPTHVRLAPKWDDYPLRNADDDDGIVFDDYLPSHLADRLYDWTLAFHAGSDDETQEYWAQFEDAADEAAHRAEGDAIVSALRDIFARVDGPIYPTDIRYHALPKI